MEVEHRGAKLKTIIPCIGNRCPEWMELIHVETPNPVYRCKRRPGYKGITGEVYTSHCYYHDHPYPASDAAYWTRDPDKKIKLDPNNPEDWETARAFAGEKANG